MNKMLNKKNFIFINRNQAKILDSIYNIGSSKKYLDKYGKYRYSEQSGYLLFDKKKLTKKKSSKKKLSKKKSHK